jgi:hypothetical protein
MRRRVGRPGQRGDDHQPARKSQPPRSDERQGAGADQQDAGPRGEAGLPHAFRVLERARDPERPAQSLIAAHADRIGDRPRERGVARPRQRPPSQLGDGRVPKRGERHIPSVSRAQRAEVRSVDVQRCGEPYALRGVVDVVGDDRLVGRGAVGELEGRSRILAVADDPGALRDRGSVFMLEASARTGRARQWTFVGSRLSRVGSRSR